MGLSSFPGSSEGLLPFLMVSTVFAITVLKRVSRSIRGGANLTNHDAAAAAEDVAPAEAIDQGRILSTRFKSLNHGGGGGGNQTAATECCVCLCRFEAEEEVSELVSCKHLFHKGCLQKWFDNRGNATSSCPLCRSVL